MNAKGSRIILYSVAAQAQQERLVQQLADVGYTRIVIAKDHDQLERLVLDGSFAALVLLFTDAAFSQNQLLDILPSSKTLPVIGLFSQDCARFELPFVQVCHEVAVWPCTRQELNYRIGKHISSFDR